MLFDLQGASQSNGTTQMKLLSDHYKQEQESLVSEAEELVDRRKVSADCRGLLQRILKSDICKKIFF